MQLILMQTSSTQAAGAGALQGRPCKYTYISPLHRLPPQVSLLVPGLYGPVRLMATERGSARRARACSQVTSSTQGARCRGAPERLTLTTPRPVLSASSHTRLPTKPLPPNTSTLGSPGAGSCAPCCTSVRKAAGAARRARPVRVRGHGRPHAGRRPSTVKFTLTSSPLEPLDRRTGLMRQVWVQATYRTTAALPPHHQPQHQVSGLKM